MAKEKDEIEFSQTESLIKEGTEFNKLYVLISLFIAFFLFLNLHTVYSIYANWVDDSIPLTICPRSFDLDAPVLMKSINENDKSYVQDRWIRGFIRRFVLNSYPRTADDAPRFFQFTYDHSDGSLKIKYKSFLNAIEDIQATIAGGRSTLFYPKNSSDIRIRPSGAGRWIVEIDGFLVKNIDRKQERTAPTLRFTVESRHPTRTNPDGLVVVDTEVATIADYVSGREFGKDSK